jgi:putative transposase
MSQSLAKILVHTVFSTKNRHPYLHDRDLRTEMRDFSWQNGYGIFSIGFSQIPTVKQYIANQEEHHRKMSFQDELRKLLRRYEIEFDERYVWD